jgi:uncharacterized lipoprotein YbaY
MIATKQCWRLLALAAIAIGLSAMRIEAQDRFGQADERRRDAVASASGGFWQASDWLGGNAANRQWRLGIDGSDTDTGVVIRTVSPRSAADRARLQAGDTIVAVDGFQVGNVGGRLFSLPEELNRRADASGMVSLLVLDHRARRLTTLRVQMEPWQSNLTGTLINTARGSLPADAIVTVQIENVSRPFFTVRNGQTSFRPTNSNTIPFQIAYDPAFVDPQDIFRVRAFVTSGGRTILETPTPQNVLTQGNPSDVGLNLAAVGQSSLVSTGGSSVVTAGYPNFNSIDEQITGMYRQYLGRAPTSLELAALHTMPGIQDRLSRMPLELMAAQEYFDLVGNNNLAWLDRVFQTLLGRRPSQLEMDQWMRRFAELRFSRTELLRQLDQARR